MTETILKTPKLSSSLGQALTLKYTLLHDGIANELNVITDFIKDEQVIGQFSSRDPERL